jgi:hypothetical protein
MKLNIYLQNNGLPLIMGAKALAKLFSSELERPHIGKKAMEYWWRTVSS